MAGEWCVGGAYDGAVPLAPARADYDALAARHAAAGAPCARLASVTCYRGGATLAAGWAGARAQAASAAAAAAPRVTVASAAEGGGARRLLAAA